MQNVCKGKTWNEKKGRREIPFRRNLLCFSMFSKLGGLWESIQNMLWHVVQLVCMILNLGVRRSGVTIIAHNSPHFLIDTAQR